MEIWPLIIGGLTKRKVIYMQCPDIERCKLADQCIDVYQYDSGLPPCAIKAYIEPAKPQENAEAAKLDVGKVAVSTNSAMVPCPLYVATNIECNLNFEGTRCSDKPCLLAQHQ